MHRGATQDELQELCNTPAYSRSSLVISQAAYRATLNVNMILVNGHHVCAMFVSAMFVYIGIARQMSSGVKAQKGKLWNLR